MRQWMFARPMPALRFLAMPTDVVRAYQAGAADAYGRPPEKLVSDGSGFPCRHCLTDVAAGEELTHDWATTDDLRYEIECHCGRPTCRKVLTGQDWRKPELREKYRGWFAWHVQRKIDADQA